MEKPDWVIDVIEGELRYMLETSTWDDDRKRPSIYKIPPCIANLNKNAYMPQVVSFGPHHHGEEHLKLMEEHKERAVVKFLNRSKVSPRNVILRLVQVADQLQNSYETLGPEWKYKTDRFLKMMILDGCFMLEILRVVTGLLNCYAPDDLIFSRHGKIHAIPFITRDMMLIENQLPILLLEELLAVEGGQGEKAIEIIKNFLCPETPLSRVQKSLHILEVYRESLLEEPEPLGPFPKPRIRTIGINYSAIQLDLAGVELKTTKTRSVSPGAITFDRGVLSLPTITVDEFTESLFLNVLAFERFHVGAGTGVTSYVHFMKRILGTEKDVALLVSKGIIVNEYGSNKEVADLFHRLPKNIGIGEDYLDFVLCMISEYLKTPWNRCRVSFVRTYFQTRWAIISLIIGFYFLGLDSTQTIYSALSYYKPNSAPLPSPPPPPSPPKM